MIYFFAILFWLFATVASDDPLRIGETLPGLSGHTVSGHEAQLPTADSGSCRVLIFSFSKAAGEDSSLWSQEWTKEPSSNRPVVSYRIIVLQSVPGLLRGMVTSTIKNRMPRALWDKTILLYKDEEFWKQSLKVTTDHHAYTVLLDGKGRIRWLSRDAFTQGGEAQLKTAVSLIEKVE